MKQQSEWLTTSTLLDGLRDFANADAWSRFVDRFRRPIAAFARRAGVSAGEADDVAQETLLHCAAALREGKFDRTRGRLSRWLFGIAYRQALNARRRAAGVSARLAKAGPELSALAATPEATQIWDEEWELGVLEDCLAQVRREVEEPTYRAFELVVQQGRSAADAAAALQVPIKLVYNAKHRILSRLRVLRAEFEEIAPPSDTS